MSFERRWADLEPIGRANSGGYRRFAWTREDAELRDWFTGEAKARGLDVAADRAGNLVRRTGVHCAAGSDSGADDTRGRQKGRRAHRRAC